VTTVGIIGSGQLGSTLARLAIGAGHEVVLSNSRGPETLADAVAQLGPQASGTPVWGAPYGPYSNEQGHPAGKPTIRAALAAATR
jgi:3-hydroxyacyl-CoA dehydrogenase